MIPYSRSGKTLQYCAALHAAALDAARRLSIDAVHRYDLQIFYRSVSRRFCSFRAGVQEVLAPQEKFKPFQSIEWEDGRFG